MEKQLVSIVMSTYRERDDHLKMAIDSVLCQTYKNIEYIIVIDDPENTHLHSILYEYALKDNRIRILKNEVNSGPTRSRNRGIQAAKGEFIAIMDADDICAPERLEIQLGYIMDHPEIGVVFSERYEIDEESNITNMSVRKLKDALLPKILKNADVLTNPTAFMRKTLLNELGGYREIICAEDYDLWLRCCTSNVIFHVIDQPLLKYRIRSDSLSHANYAKSWVGAEYARYLYKQRLSKGKDSFSTEDYNTFLSESILRTPQSTEKFNSAYDKYYTAIGCVKDKKMCSVLKNFVAAFFTDHRILQVLINNIKVKRSLKEAMR